MEERNLYTYVFNDPINWIDPWGTDAWSAAGSFAEGVVAGAVGAIGTAGAVASGTVAGAGAAVAAAFGAGFGAGVTAIEFVSGEDYWTFQPLCPDERWDKLAGLAGGLVGGGLSGPRGPLFGRGRLRGSGQSGIFNRGDFRIGWSWHQGKNRFGVHGGVPGTPGHWHQTPIPGPSNPGWW